MHSNDNSTISTPKRMFQPGDVVTHLSGRWLEGDRQVIDHVNSELFPDDPVAFFLGGGFWRTSRLVLVEPVR